MMYLNKTAINRKLNELASEYAKALKLSLGKDLISVVLFGSVARQEASSVSDIDLLIIAKNLPRGQLERKARLRNADEEIAPIIEDLSLEEVYVAFSRIVKTPEEAQRIVPLYLDLVEDAVLLWDRDGFFQGILSALRDRLDALGAHRITSGSIRYWDLKPDLVPGERFSL